jgi:hypothetical protein
MNLKLYAIFDTASGVYDGPHKARGHGEMIRSFSDICCNKDHPIGAHPEHFFLYHVGEWNDDTGTLEPIDRVCLITGEEAVAQSRQVNSANLAAFNEAISVGGTD